MTPALAELEPKDLWKHFDALAAIPRASTKEAAARDYVLSIAAKHKLEATHDKVGNTVIRKPAHPGANLRPWLCCKVISTWSARRTKAPRTTSTPIPSR